MDENEIRYALAKQLDRAYELTTGYGEIELDDELKEAIDAAIRPILEARLKRLTGADS